jgi:hypothetical protein
MEGEGEINKGLLVFRNWKRRVKKGEMENMTGN